MAAAGAPVDGARAGAAEHGELVARHAPETRGSSATEHTAQGSEERYSLSVCTLSGECVWRYEGNEDLSIERLLQDFDEGYIPNVPRVRVCENGTQVEGYQIWWENMQLKEGQHLSDYADLPPNAIFTLVKSIVDPWTKLFDVRRRHMSNDMLPILDESLLQRAYNDWLGEWISENLTPAQQSKNRTQQTSIFAAWLHKTYGGKYLVLEMLRSGLTREETDYLPRRQP